MYDTAPGHPDALTVWWHHGSPNIGAPPAPLLPLAAELGIRWVSHDRPSYGGSTPNPGRDLASTAADVGHLADALGIESFAAMGHSSGGPNALASAALLPGRVLAVVSIAGLAPYDAEGLDWFAGFGATGVAELRAAASGRAALERHLAEKDGDPPFTGADEMALAGEWSWFIDVVRPAIAAGMDGLIEDDLASVSPWGFEPAAVDCPALFVHGGQDRVVPSSHSEWSAGRTPNAELRLHPEDSHISIMGQAAPALRWLHAAADPRRPRP